MQYDSVQIVQRLAPGGIEVLAVRLAQSLPGRNAIISLEGETEALRASWPLLGSSGVEIHALGKKGGVSPALVWRLARLLWRLRPRTAFTHHIGPLLYGGLAARLVDVCNLVHVEHDVWHHREPRRVHQMRLASAVLHPTFAAISTEAAEAVRRATGTKTVVILPNGVDIAAYGHDDRAAARGSLGLPASGRVIGTVGRLEKVKGHDVLIRAMALMPEDVRLAVVGDGGARTELTRLAEELQLSGRVLFAGHRDDVARLYPAFDVFCLPSRREGLPIAVLEAQASGVPVVATDVGAVRDALCPLSGRAVPPEDPAALAAALASVLGAPAVVSPRAFVAQSFDWDTTIRRYTILSRG